MEEVTVNKTRVQRTVMILTREAIIVLFVRIVFRSKK